MPSKGGELGSGRYFEWEFKGPWKGVDVMMPEDDISPMSTPSMQNMILRNGEIRTRPRMSLGLSGTPDNKPITMLTTFMDSNNVIHTVADTATGLWQLNSKWDINKPKLAWSLIGSYPVQPGPGLPDAHITFLDRLYWTNGGNNLWSWDGITSTGAPSRWPGAKTQVIAGKIIQGSDGKIHVCSKAGTLGSTQPVWGVGVGTVDNDGSAQWTNNGTPALANGFESVAIVDATNGITAGAYYLGELNSRMIMLSTLEGTIGGFQSFPQRVRWTPSGIPNIWDVNVNIGAGFTDEFDVPDAITGFLTIGRTGYIFRTNGITEMLTGSSGINPWNFNHLWASDRGIGNIFPFSVAGYGPIGIFASNEDFYELSLGGLKNIGGTALDAIYNDLANTSSIPVATIVPYLAQNYIYMCYKLDIPLNSGGSRTWVYYIKDQAWQSWFKPNGIFTGRTRFVVNR